MYNLCKRCALTNIKTRHMKRTVVSLLTVLLFSTSQVQAQSQEFENDLLKYRAIEAAVWAMPIMNFKKYRDALNDNGVGYNDVAYNSKLQNWKFQTATPNNTTLNF